jgi:hypothetical protein
MAAEQVGAEVRVGVDYLGIGQVDASMRFTWAGQPNPEPEKWRFFFTLVHTPTPEEASPKVESSTMSRRSVQWKIKDFQSEPVVSISAATGYVRSVLNNTADPVIRKNAQATLATLGRIDVR